MKNKNFKDLVDDQFAWLVISLIVLGSIAYALISIS